MRSRVPAVALALLGACLLAAPPAPAATRVAATTYVPWTAFGGYRPYFAGPVLAGGRVAWGEYRRDNSWSIRSAGADGSLRTLATIPAAGPGAGRAWHDVTLLGSTSRLALVDDVVRAFGSKGMDTVYEPAVRRVVAGPSDGPFQPIVGCGPGGPPCKSDDCTGGRSVRFLASLDRDSLHVLDACTGPGRALATDPNGTRRTLGPQLRWMPVATPDRAAPIAAGRFALFQDRADPGTTTLRVHEIDTGAEAYRLTVAGAISGAALRDDGAVAFVTQDHALSWASQNDPTPRWIATVPGGREPRLRFAAGRVLVLARNTSAVAEDTLT